MPAFGPLKWRDLVAALRQAGFDGPYPGSKHQYMTRDGFKLTIPNPHDRDIDRKLLSKILRQAGISREDWEQL